MTLKVLGDTTFTPKFSGNKKMKITLHVLSGEEELSIGYGETRDKSKFFDMIVSDISDPLKLEFPDETREMRKEDIRNLGILKDLYMEIIMKYGEISTLSDTALGN